MYGGFSTCPPLSPSPTQCLAVKPLDTQLSLAIPLLGRGSAVLRYIHKCESARKSASAHLCVQSLKKTWIYLLLLSGYCKGLGKQRWSAINFQVYIGRECAVGLSTYIGHITVEKDRREDKGHRCCLGCRIESFFFRASYTVCCTKTNWRIGWIAPGRYEE